MKSLYLGASFAPLIEHAASHIQDSRDFELLLAKDFVPKNWGQSKNPSNEVNSFLIRNLVRLVDF